VKGAYWSGGGVGVEGLRSLIAGLENGEGLFTLKDVLKAMALPYEGERTKPKRQKQG